MLAVALEDEVAAYSPRSRVSVMSRAGGWWCAMGTRGRGR